jgi:type IV secretory pathway VirB2 component (pilin)
VVLKRLIAATASIALMATPAMAAGTSAAASSTAAPATEKVSGLQDNGGTGNIAVIVAAIIAVGLGIYFLTKNHDHPPASP